jgi:hypothetical protein
VLTLPAATKAPTSAASQLKWIGNTANESYAISFENPSGAVVSTQAVSGTTPVTYSAGSAVAGAWKIVASGFTSNSCLNGVSSGTSGVATGTASWFE